jgi:hypothetical protein
MIDQISHVGLEMSDLGSYKMTDYDKLGDSKEQDNEALFTQKIE